MLLTWLAASATETLIGDLLLRYRQVKSSLRLLFTGKVSRL